MLNHFIVYKNDRPAAPAERMVSLTAALTGRPPELNVSIETSTPWYQHKQYRTWRT